MASVHPLSDRGAATRHALRTATGVTLCFLVGEYLQFRHTNLAVWTTYMVMAQHPFTNFQKGIERVVGRALGVLAGLLIATWLLEAPVLAIGCLTFVLLVCFYIYFAGRLSYTFLNAGLYAVVLFDIGRSTPDLAPAEGAALCFAIMLGVAVADIVDWLAGAESSLVIELGKAPLWPIRRDWLNQSLMLAVTVLVASEAARMLELPVLDSVISVMMLTITPDIQSLIQKGELRVVGAILALLYSLCMIVVMALQPYFLLMAMMLFLGILLAAYITHAGGSYSYAGVQMGLVLPMIVVNPPEHFGSMSAVTQRLEGIVIAMIVSLIIGSLWPRSPFRGSAPTS
ncbi:hypothetical protein BH10PLA2_BH10PLA2_15120 [soil metagenome]